MDYLFFEYPRRITETFRTESSNSTPRLRGKEEGKVMY